MSELDHWLTCPMCGSPKARIDIEPPAIFTYCPECHDMDMAKYPDGVVEYQSDKFQTDNNVDSGMVPRLVGAVEDTKDLDELDPHENDYCVVCGKGSEKGVSMHPVTGIENACICEDCNNE